MKSGSYLSFAIVAAFLTLCLSVSVMGQGRGHGNAGGNKGGSSMGGPPSGVGVDRGLGNASDRSNGRSDAGLGNASDKSNGRSDAGLERARIASDNLNRADNDLRDHPGIPRLLKTNANGLRDGYRAALGTNPNLKFGQYVSATRVSQNLGGRFPNVTRSNILSGLASGRSLGQTLQDLGVNDRDAKDAKKQAEREIKDARRN
ncbi:MAG TPA: hypothetical protein VLB68_20995 [Pyrinomonadaceae bacterium]|nr:hypothetical protein [Pyrinomonadaceae bacterium]